MSTTRVTPTIVLIVSISGVLSNKQAIHEYSLAAILQDSSKKGGC